MLTPFLLSGTSNQNEIDRSIYGIWKSADNEFLQISETLDFETKFTRYESTNLASKGFIINTTEGTIRVSKHYPVKETYDLPYVFSPSGKTIVIMKPNSEQAWVFERIQ